MSISVSKVWKCLHGEHFGAWVWISLNLAVENRVEVSQLVETLKFTARQLADHFGMTTAGARKLAERNGWASSLEYNPRGPRTRVFEVPESELEAVESRGVLRPASNNLASNGERRTLAAIHSLEEFLRSKVEMLTSGLQQIEEKVERIERRIRIGPVSIETDADPSVCNQSDTDRLRPVILKRLNDWFVATGLTRQSLSEKLGLSPRQVGRMLERDSLVKKHLPRLRSLGFNPDSRSHL